MLLSLLWLTIKGLSKPSIDCQASGETERAMSTAFRRNELRMKIPPEGGAYMLWLHFTISGSLEPSTTFIYLLTSTVRELVDSHRSAI